MDSQFHVNEHALDRHKVNTIFNVNFNAEKSFEFRTPSIVISKMLVCFLCNYFRPIL